MEKNKLEQYVETSIKASGNRQKDLIYEDVKRRISFMGLSGDDYEYAIKHMTNILKI